MRCAGQPSSKPHESAALGATQAPGGRLETSKMSSMQGNTSGWRRGSGGRDEPDSLGQPLAYVTRRHFLGGVAGAKSLL